MTQEQKIKAYDEALERAKIWQEHLNESGDNDYAEELSYIFPELKEREDEESKKWILEYLYDGLQKSDEQFKDHFKTAIAWLEKQGEQPKGKEQVDNQNCEKPTDNIEPKYKEGDWIISNNKKSIYQVIEVKRGVYVIRDNADNHEYHISIEGCEKSGRLWTIKDAKDGDVLASELCDSIILFGGIKDNNIDFYCDYDFSEIDIPGDRFAINNGQHYGNLQDSKDFHPATKEQRDALLKAMADAGYEFDFEKKELKKIE